MMILNKISSLQLWWAVLFELHIPAEDTCVYPIDMLLARASKYYKTSIMHISSFLLLLQAIEIHKDVIQKNTPIAW